MNIGLRIAKVDGQSMPGEPKRGWGRVLSETIRNKKDGLIQSRLNGITPIIWNDLERKNNVLPTFTNTSINH